MPWAGGVYTRGYPSWSADASSNLPISASKFDTEDNDFAAGLNNCLTKDGLNGPNTAFTWSLTNGQILQLNRGSDGIVFGLGRTGGANNPSFSFTIADTGGLTISAAGSTGINILAAGNLSVLTPSSGNALNAQAVAGSNAAFFTGSTTSGQSFGIVAKGGTTSADYAQQWLTSAGVLIAVMKGNGSFTFSAPSTAITAFTINGAATTGYLAGVQVVAPNTTGQSNGLGIAAGTNSSDAPLIIQNAAKTFNYLQLLGDTSFAFQRAAATATLSSNAAGNITIAAPSSGIALAASGVSGASTIQLTSASGAATVATDLLVNRPGSTANAIQQGPNITLFDTTNSTVTCLQQAGGQSELWQFNGGWARRWFVDTTGNLNISNGASSLSPVYAGIPQNAQPNSYTFVLSDANKHLLHNSASAGHVYTVPANASVAYPIGTAITICTGGGTTLSLAINADTLTWLPSGASGTRTLASGAMVTLLKVTSTIWFMTGVGVT